MRIAVPSVLGPSGNSTAGACQRPDKSIAKHSVPEFSIINRCVVCNDDIIYQVKLLYYFAAFIFLISAKLSANSHLPSHSYMKLQVANCCYKLLENPEVVKCKKTLEFIFHVLGVLIKRYSHCLGLPISFFNYDNSLYPDIIQRQCLQNK